MAKSMAYDGNTIAVTPSPQRTLAAVPTSPATYRVGITVTPPQRAEGTPPPVMCFSVDVAHVPAQRARRNSGGIVATLQVLLAQANSATDYEGALLVTDTPRSYFIHKPNVLVARAAALGAVTTTLQTLYSDDPHGVLMMQRGGALERLPLPVRRAVMVAALRQRDVQVSVGKSTAAYQIQYTDLSPTD